MASFRAAVHVAFQCLLPCFPFMVSIRIIRGTCDWLANQAPANKGQPFISGFKSWFSVHSLPDCLSAVPNLLISWLRPCLPLTCLASLSPGKRSSFQSVSALSCFQSPLIFSYLVLRVETFLPQLFSLVFFGLSFIQVFMIYYVDDLPFMFGELCTAWRKKDANWRVWCFWVQVLFIIISRDIWEWGLNPLLLACLLFPSTVLNCTLAAIKVWFDCFRKNVIIN